MYPSRFHYEAPRSLDEAFGVLQAYGDEAKILAGGQSLIPLIKLRFASPACVVDINNIPGLEFHEEDSDGSLHIGALCRHRDLERSALLRSKYPVMSAVAPLISDPMVRNRGTLVGSLCHADPQGDWAASAPSQSLSLWSGRSRTPCNRGRSRSGPECPRREERVLEPT
jgi:aerobic carbon-monoxide dehydrogenase medium subunit